MKTNKYGALNSIATYTNVFAFIVLISGFWGIRETFDILSTYFSHELALASALILLAILFLVFLYIRAQVQFIFLMIDMAEDVNEVNLSFHTFLEEYEKRNIENQEKIIQLLSKQNNNPTKINEDEL